MYRGASIFIGGAADAHYNRIIEYNIIGYDLDSSQGDRIESRKLYSLHYHRTTCIDVPSNVLQSGKHLQYVGARHLNSKHL